MLNIPPSFIYYFEQLFLTGRGDYDSIGGAGPTPIIRGKVGLQTDDGFIIKPSYKQMNQVITTFHQSGWKKNTIQKSLRGIHDGLLDGHSLDDVVIPSLAYAQYHQIGYKGSIYKTLIACGIYHVRAVHVERALQSLYDSCYTYDQLMYISIDYLLGHYTPVRDNETAYLFPFSLHTWYTSPISSPNQVMNVNYPCMKDVYKNVSKVIQTIPYNKKTHSLFFHATNWRGYLYISEQINHNAGRKCLDFGYHPSFYITPTLYDAVEWGEKRSGNFSHEIAIMIFIVPNKFKKQLDYMELSGDLWKKVVVDSRRCKKDVHKNSIFGEGALMPRYNGMFEMKELRYKDFVYGAILQNPAQVLEKGSPPIAFHKKQMASKTDNGDKYLQKCLFGAICFRKGGDEGDEGDEGVDGYKSMHG